MSFIIVRGYLGGQIILKGYEGPDPRAYIVQNVLWDFDDRESSFPWEYDVAQYSRFSWRVGQDRRIVFTATSPTAISGWAITIQIFQGQGGVLLRTYTVGAGITVVDPENGVFRLTLPAADTQQMGVNACWLNAWRTDGGDFAPLAEGLVVVQP